MTALLLRMFVKDYRNAENPKVRASVGKLAGVTGIICNILLFVGKVLAGLMAGSVSMIADAINNLTDASSSIVTLIGFKLAQMPADEEHPYGHARFEYISGLVVAALILLIGVELFKTSFGKILHPALVSMSWITGGILVVSILVKFWLAYFNRKLGEHIQSTALMASAADSRNDVISTLAVLAGCGIGAIFELPVDGYIGVAVAIFIIISGCGVAKETISPLLGGQADEELVQSVYNLLLSNDKILGMHDLLVHDYGPGQCFASVHAEMDAHEDPLVCHDILDDLEAKSLKELKVHLVIHYDPIVTDDEELNHMREVVSRIICGIDPRLHMHDFRLLRGAQCKKLIFDLVLPFGMKVSKRGLKKQIDDGILENGGDYETVICYDRGGYEL